MDKHGKLFKDLRSNTVLCLDYDTSQNYYAFIKTHHQKGLRQCIITSDIMVGIIEHFIYDKVKIISIEFMVDDDDLHEEVRKILELMIHDNSYWSELKQKILFLSKNNCVEIKKVEFINFSDNGSILSVNVNGLISTSITFFKRVSDIVCNLVEGHVK